MDGSGSMSGEARQQWRITSAQGQQLGRGVVRIRKREVKNSNSGR